MIKNKKSQVVTEFFLNYGWAILASIIAIAILMYLGVFSPNYSPKCYEDYAKAFCKKMDKSFINGSILRQFSGTNFKCGDNQFLDEKQRLTGSRDSSETYYFIDSEINDCKNRK